MPVSLLLRQAGLPGLLVCAALLTGCVTMDSPTKGFLSSYDGFESETKRGPLLYKGDLSKLSSYNKAHIGDVRVLVESEDTKASRAELRELSDIFEKILREEFGKQFDLTRSTGKETLEVRAALVDVKPNSPGWFVAGYAPGVFVATTALWAATGENPGSGVTTIQLEVLDAETKERFYAIIDEERGGKHKVRGGLTRWGQAEVSFRKWSEEVVAALAQ